MKIQDNAHLIASMRMVKDNEKTKPIKKLIAMLLGKKAKKEDSKDTKSKEL